MICIPGLSAKIQYERGAMGIRSKCVPLDLITASLVEICSGH